ncbi:Ref family recombination enhancement nuclease [Pseudomonas monteilii]
MSFAGRTVTKTERQWHDDLAYICGCICCLLDGRPRDYTKPGHVSIHHCDGRTKAHAHYYVLPLCAGHHQPGHGPVKTLCAVHGNKAAFIETYGREIQLVDACVQLVERAGRTVPDGVQRLLARWAEHRQYQEAQAC